MTHEVDNEPMIWEMIKHITGVYRLPKGIGTIPHNKPVEPIPYRHPFLNTDTQD